MMRIVMILLTALPILTGCKKQISMEEGNAVYFWRTDFRLDSTERTFLKQHHISKVYCRYFDVVMNEAQEPMPNATITFSDSLPKGIELIPTIYITVDCLQKSHKGLAAKLVRRILQMNETNDIKGVKEIQIDHDYTARNKKIYYQFLEEVRQEIRKADASFQLSATIRLHQLSMEAPPVDYGVLMIYNTGNPDKFMERNPILDHRDVQPYLKYLDDYSLPMAAAYPVYQWVRNIHGVRIEHAVEATEILLVKHTIEKAQSNLKRSIIIYHLDKENIDRYKPKTYEEIYHH